MFRTLRADEIDCRIAQIKENGLSLLLYKDARCDQNILDEVVGPFNWKREHTRDNRNCTLPGISWVISPLFLGIFICCNDINAICG